MRLCWIRLATVCLMLLTSFSLLSGQTNTTSLSGGVQDPSGANIVGAKVTISNPETGVNLAAESGKAGEYGFNQVAPGKYTVTVNYPGFSEQTQSVELLVNSPVKVNFKLTVGSSEIVNVDTTIAAVNSTDGTLGKAFDSKQVQNLPYLANNITYLLSLQPGVLALDPGATTGGLNQDTRTGIVNGARQDQSNITMDGVDNNDQNNGYAFNGVLRATRESVEEFRVVTTNGNADSGRSSGAQVSLVTRSGTNQFHGSAYEYYRDPGASANNWFLKQSQLSTHTPNIAAKILQHTYGASLGAPLMKNKLFFFGAYEGFKQASDSVVTEMVPSVQSPVGGLPTLNGFGGLITGNVSYINASAGVTTLSPSQIAGMDPKCTGNGSCPNGPGTNAAAIAYFRQFPLANTNTSGDSYNTGGYTFASPAPIHQITNIARLDYTINSRQSVFIRGNLQSDNQLSTLQFPGEPANSSTFGNNRGIAAGHIWAINDHLTNNFRYGFTRQGSAQRGTGSQPYTSFGGLTALNGTTTSSVYIEPVNNFIDDVTFVKGRHTIQFGVNDRTVSNSRYADAAFQESASVSVNLLTTAAIAGKGTSLDPGAFGLPAVTSSFRTSYNNAILGNTGIIEQAQSGTAFSVQGNSLVAAPTGTIPTHIFHNVEQEYYVQDQWRATSRLSITAGIRYVYLGVPYEIHGQEIAPTLGLSTFLQNRLAAAGSGAAYTTRLSFAPAGSANGQPNFWSPQKLNFAPRLAFAYATADNRTSIRGGFAIAYDHFGDSVIDYYNAGTSGLFGLNRSNVNNFSNTALGITSNVDTNPRFTGYRNIPIGPVSTASLTLPYTPPDQPFTFDRSINNVQKTPYAETFNLSVQHEVIHGMTITASYVGRLGRHVLANLDVAQPTNLVDPTSGQSYFQAATAYDKMIDAGVSSASVPDSGYFHNVFPNATFKVGNVTYKGAQAYYASLQGGDRGNETDTLYNYDSGTAASPGGQSFRFFYPQTSSIYAQSSSSTSNYNALQLSVRHSLKYGLEYDLNYTYGKSMDYGSSPERSSTSNTIINTYNPSQMYAVSDYDVRHNVTANYNVPLPFGKGKPFFSQANGFIDHIIGGWQLNGVAHYSTGFPYSANASGNYGTNFESSSNFVQIGPIATGGHRYVTTGTSPYETTLKNQTPAQAFANLRYAYAGESGQRNNFRADGYFSLDDGLTKSFKTYREQEFRISVEVFNVTNSVRFGGSATGGGAGSGVQTNGASTLFGEYTGTLLTNPRQMQFSGKYYF
jgi:hypothetical protein